MARVGLVSGLLASLLAVLLPAAELPSHFDLREYNWVSPVRDQGRFASCWAMAGASAMESNLLRQGIFSNPDDPGLRLSPWHMLTRGLLSYSLKPPYEGWAGTPQHLLAYLTRGQGAIPLDQWHLSPDLAGGPVQELAHQFNRYPAFEIECARDLRSVLPPADQPLAYVLRQGVLFKRWTAESEEQHRHRLKQAIQNYGALYTTLRMGPSGLYYDHRTQTYNSSVYSGASNHAVLLIGWDDQRACPGTQQRGAWLVQNSWGRQFGQLGFFWVSYADTECAHQAWAFQLSPRGKLSGACLQPQSGFPVGSLPKMTRAAACFRVPQPQTIAAIGLWNTVAQQTLRFRLHKGWTFSGTQWRPGEVIEGSSGEVVLPETGYYLLDLPRPQTVQGDLVVSVDYSEPLPGVPYEPLARAPRLRTFVFAGGAWYDFAGQNPGGAFFVKLYLAKTPAAVLATTRPTTQAVAAKR